MINTLADLRYVHYNCYFQTEQDIAAMAINELAQEVRMRGFDYLPDWQPAVVMPVAKKRQRRLERLMNRLGIPWDMSVEYGNGRTEYYRLKPGEAKPVD